MPIPSVTFIVSLYCMIIFRESRNVPCPQNSRQFKGMVQRNAFAQETGEQRLCLQRHGDGVLKVREVSVKLLLSLTFLQIKLVWEKRGIRERAWTKTRGQQRQRLLKE